MVSRFCLLVFTVLCGVNSVFAAPSVPWVNSLYLGRDGYWQQRIEVQITNNTARPLLGEPVALPVGTSQNQIPLAGVDAKSLRVCNDQGQEMLWLLTGANGRSVTTGRITAGSKLVIPADNKPHGTARYFVYIDNPKAWAVPDFLSSTGEFENGGVEDGQGNTPTRWKNDSVDSQHIASWSTESPHSGKRCLKTVVAHGAEPTWVSTRQENLRLTPGFGYELSAWVRTKDVVGSVGMYIHVGNTNNFMVISPMAQAKPGTNDWHKVSVQFTVPADCYSADLGTVLHGTGTAWFDDISLKSTAKAASIQIKIMKPEYMNLAVKPLPSVWPNGMNWCVPIKLFNFTSTPQKNRVVCIDIVGIRARMGRSADINRVMAWDGQRKYPCSILRNTLLVSGVAIPAKSAVNIGLYVPIVKGKQSSALTMQADRSTGTTEDARQNDLNGSGKATSDISMSAYNKIVNSPANLVRNPDFESGEQIPSGWGNGVEGTLGQMNLNLDDHGICGRKCAKITVAKNDTQSWVGWRQKIDIKPGASYLCSAWMKCSQLSAGSPLYLHIVDAKGDVISYTSLGTLLSGDIPWTLQSGIITMPSNARALELHLTTNGAGTLWHDGVVVTEVSTAQAFGLLTKPQQNNSMVNLWQVNAIQKVFRDTLPTGKDAPQQVSMAQNEKEPLQLALRSVRALGRVQVVVTAPANKSGAKLGVDVGMVGYVPVDYPSNYYQDTNPAWYRKVPQTTPGCDGWAGMWPDPIYPKDTSSVDANSTQPIWITFITDKATSPGDYKGQVRIVSSGKTIKSVPYKVHVWGFSLPVEQNTVAVYDVRVSDTWQNPGQTSEQARRQLWKMMANYRLCPDRIYPNPDIRYENGKAITDFGEYDKAADYYFNELHLPTSYTPDVFYMFGWGYPPSDHFGEKPFDGEFPYDGVDRRKLRPEFKTAFKACLKAYWDHMKQKGWDKKIAYYISDEPFYSQPATIAQMQALCEMIKEVDPNIPIYSSTWGYVKSWDNYLSLWGIGHFGDVPAETIRDIRARGARVRFTTDGQMCLDTPSCAIERLLPHYAYKYGVEGYEFWGSTWLTYNPHQYGWHSYIPQTDTPGKSYYVRYPCGDGYIIYPGVPAGYRQPIPSVRMAQAREGAEDYEYLHLLSQLIDKAKRKGVDVLKVQKALDAAQNLVGMPSAGGRYSSLILPDADTVFTTRKQLAEAIMWLQKQL